MKINAYRVPGFKQDFYWDALSGEVVILENFLLNSFEADFFNETYQSLNDNFLNGKSAYDGIGIHIGEVFTCNGYEQKLIRTS